MKEIDPEYRVTADYRTVNPERFGLSGVALLGISRFRRSHPPTEEHIHRDMLEIGFCLRNPLVLNVSGREYPVMPGEFFVSQPNTPHHLTTRPAGVFLYYFLLRRPTKEKKLFDLPLCESNAIWHMLLRLPSNIAANTHAANVRRMFAEVFQLCDMRKTAWTTLKMRQLFLSIVTMLLEQAQRGGEKADLCKVANIAEMIKSHPEQHFTVRELAEKMALSPTHFINMFRLATGFPPIKFQIQSRIERSKSLLKETATPIADIALELGFASHQHFSDTFSRIVGVSPNQWRSSRPIDLGK